MNDQQILEEIRSGMPGRALRQLYRHLPAIRRMIAYYGGSRQQAEDIFQEALIVLCRKAKEESFALPSGVYPYLYSVCRFMWNDEQKKSARLPLADLEDTAVEAGAESIIATLEEEARYRQAEQIISGLGDRCREILLLFYAGKMKLNEIAARMGYGSEASAKNQKYKCLEAARAEYRKSQTISQYQ